MRFPADPFWCCCATGTHYNSIHEKVRDGILQRSEQLVPQMRRRKDFLFDSPAFKAKAMHFLLEQLLGGKQEARRFFQNILQ